MARIIGRKVSNNEFRLTRCEAEMVYFADLRAQKKAVGLPLPLKPNTGRHICRTGAVLFRSSVKGSHPYTLLGDGAMETIAWDATTLQPGRNGMHKVHTQLNRK